jgi:hypothetical protein
LPAINQWDQDVKRIKDGKKVAENFSYTSENNDHWMNVSDLQSWIRDNEPKIGTF